jgi:tetratricopeptide (TPR) repeat protein
MKNIPTTRPAFKAGLCRQSLIFACKNMMRILFVLLPVTLFFACQSGPNPDERQVQKEALAKLEAPLREARDIAANAEIAETFIEKTEAFVAAFPDDSLAAPYLFKAADAARGLRKYGLSIKLAGQVWRQYPGFHLAPDAMFMQGFTYDTHLGDPDNARIYYEQFLEKYPEHQLATNVRQLLDVLGENPEDLIKRFQKEEE